MANNKQIPAGWHIKALGDVCDVIMGQSPPSNTYNEQGLGLPFFQGKADFTELHPKPVKYCDAPGKIALSNDVLISVRAPVGALNIADRKCCIGRGLAAIRYSNHKYVYYYLKSIAHELDKKGTGTTFKAISGQILRATLLPLPSEKEQIAIVSKIEELFSELDKGIESLKKAQQQLTVYRRSVLKWAFEGRLTNDSMIDGELPEEWKWVEIAEVADSLDHRRKPINRLEREKRQGQIPYYGANGRTGWIDDYLFDEPLILVVEDETFVGRELPFSYKIAGKTWVNNHAHILKPKYDVDLDFLN